MSTQLNFSDMNFAYHGPFVSTIWCEDIREENSGKRIYIGCYGSTMVSDSFPMSLRSLLVDVRVAIPLNIDFTSVRLLVFADNDPIQEFVIENAKDQLTSLIERNESIPNGSNIFTLGRIFRFDDIEISDPLIFRVVALLDDKPYRGMGLRVIGKPSATIE